jgi:hypothetical protein
MKLEKSQLSYIQEDDHLYRVLHNGEIFSFTTPVMGIPFGVDQEYGKIMCRLEYPEEHKMNTQYIHLKKIIEKIEKYVCEKFDVRDDELKSVIRKKEGLPDLIECRIKEIKKNVITKVTYENKSDNYLKGVFDIPEKSYGVAKLEWFGIFDYRDSEDAINSGSRKHKIGILLYINKLTVKE